MLLLLYGNRSAPCLCSGTRLPPIWRRICWMGKPGIPGKKDMALKTRLSSMLCVIALIALCGELSAAGLSVDARAMQSMLAFIGIQAPQMASSLSPGCVLPAPETIPGEILVDGRRRQYILAVPGAYRPGQPHQLVFAFHGRTNSNVKARGYFGLESHAANTLFVYPGGIASGRGSYSWFGTRDSAGALRDYAFFDALLGYIEANYCVDRERVFLVAHSLGASFANSLACARAGQIRGVATLAGGIMPSRCGGPVAAMVMHNPKDRLVPVAHGIRARDHFLTQNGIESTPVGAGPQHFNCRRYGDARNPVLWCPHNHDHSRRGRYYPHNWPALTGKTIMDFFASLP